MRTTFSTVTLLAGITGASLAVSLSFAKENSPLSSQAPKTPDFVIIADVKVKPNKVLEFKKTVIPYAEETRKESGTLAYIVHQSPDDPTEFKTYEHWKSDEGRAAHLAAPHTVTFFKKVTPFFEPGYPIRHKVVELR